MVRFAVTGVTHTELRQRAIEVLVDFSGLDARNFDPHLADAVRWTLSATPSVVAADGAPTLWRGDVEARL